eukprot:gnl/Chilomastix_caulleri/1560.p1 GENE.gnl/Chilomastix_caulleri/1560~~gnl/Chilomastix_caulleri/1560.p1  ORF type:complete len:62 (+),score=9.26 gnl/Chilomastix_caulleri/1560:103-288(+)
MSRIPDLSGITIRSGEFHFDGTKPTVLEFWAPWCPPCRGMVPHMNELFKQYKQSKLRWSLH